MYDMRILLNKMYQVQVSSRLTVNLLNKLVQVWIQVDVVLAGRYNLIMIIFDIDRYELFIIMYCVMIFIHNIIIEVKPQKLSEG